MNIPKDIIVQIGVGEHIPHTLARAYVDKFAGIEEMRFVDISQERLEAVAATCHALNAETGRQIKITTSTDPMTVLEEATMVVFAFAIDWPQTTMDDYARAARHGIPMAEGETIGIGGGLQAMRHLKVAKPVMDRMSRVCPEAWCVVSTNPVRHLVDYATRYARLRKCMGLCHGAEATIRYLEKAGGIPFGTLDFLVAGANHFIWYLKLWSRETGEDYYPKLMEILERQNLDGEMSRRVAQLFGLYPGNGASHVPDAFGFFAEEIWKKYDIKKCLSGKHYDPFLDFTRKDVSAEQIKARMEAGTALEGNKRWVGHMRKIRDGKTSAQELLKHLADAADEHAGRVIKTFFKSDTMYYNQALIIPNQGAVPNLPADAVVEVPGVSNRTGAYPVVVGPLPDAPAELIRRQLTIGRLHVDAAATGSRRALDQAILLDPTVKNIDSAMAFLDDTLVEAENLYPKLA
jgi:alpha-galactosidase